MRVLTAAEMRACDERTIREFDTSRPVLMENAGLAVARFVLREFSQAARIAVLCGKGNNGGDGLVAARHLAAAGRQVTICLLAAVDRLCGEARAAFDGLPAELRASVQVVETEQQMEAACALVHRAELILDAVFGTGFRPPLPTLVAVLRERIADSPAPVVSVDLPSGWDADATAMHAAEAFRSDAVVTFTAPKIAHMFGEMTRGPVAVAAIGSPEAAIQSGQGLTWTGGSQRLIEAPRRLDSNKGLYGHVLVVGGSPGKAGAPAMSSLAAMRAGAGLLTAAVPRGVAGTVAGFAPEMMTLPLTASAAGGISIANLDPAAMKSMLEKISVLAVGPGLGQEPETAEFVRELIGRTSLPAVVDADGLNAFAGRAERLDGRARTLVLTPHPGEMARLLDTTIAEVERDRVRTAREFARAHHLTLVLKGWRTLVAHPDGRVAVNTSGNPAMAKGGSGDVLTGIVAALMAQFPGDVAGAVECAVWLHGRAADGYVQQHDEHTMLATDMLRYLSEAMRLPVERDGFTWLQEGQR